jgi:hydrogenase maturation protein HypF
MNAPLAGLKITITGIVQGVGFRPFVYGLAVKYRLSGQVWNNSNGVDIEVFGNQETLDRFCVELRSNPPVLSRIDKFNSAAVPFMEMPGFTILASQTEEGQFLPVSPDMSICPDCLRELFDPKDRRYRYPFINCTNCGPRFSIIKDIPYDRPLTTMADFKLCPTCQAEYEDPLNRRFHAQPIACPDCGPRLQFIFNDQIIAKFEGALSTAREFLQDGKIIAVKGLGGYHLACDAASEHAVNQLRLRKKRSDRPFALMAFDLDTIKRYCEVSEIEADKLQSPQHPIVLLRKREDRKSVV